MAEAGVKDLVVYSWQAAAAPKGLPRGSQNEARGRACGLGQSPDVKAKFEAVGFDVVASTAQQFAEFQDDEMSRWKTVIETGKITAE